MVTVNAEIYPPSSQENRRTVFAFGLVKVKMTDGKGSTQRCEDVNVLGLVVIEDHQQPKQDDN